MESIHIIIICLECKAPAHVRRSHASQRSWPFFDFDAAASEEPPAPGKAGWVGLIWALLLTITAMCGNFAGTVELAQMTGQSLLKLWSFWIK